MRSRRMRRRHGLRQRGTLVKALETPNGARSKETLIASRSRRHRRRRRWRQRRAGRLRRQRRRQRRQRDLSSRLRFWRMLPQIRHASPSAQSPLSSAAPPRSMGRSQQRPSRARAWAHAVSMGSVSSKEVPAAIAESPTFAEKMMPLAEKITEYILDHQDNSIQIDIDR